jgi:disulfide bond formation protein DsbB
MSEGCALISAGIYLLLLVIIQIWLGVAVNSTAHEMQDNEVSSTDFMNQVAEDWLLKPFVKIDWTNATSCPEETPELVFHRKWHGSDIGCDCLGVWSSDIDYDDSMIGQRQCTYNETRDGCLQAYPKAPVLMG